jgi:hypothetical protein
MQLSNAFLLFEEIRSNLLQNIVLGKAATEDDVIDLVSPSKHSIILLFQQAHVAFHHRVEYRMQLVANDG